MNLDMEEYRDLDITKTAFMETLDQEPFKNYSAGIVLQAYLPDSYNIQKELTEREKRHYLAEMRDDINYFRASYKHAHAAVDIAGLNADQAAARVQADLEKIGPTA